MDPVDASVEPDTGSVLAAVVTCAVTGAGVGTTTGAVTAVVEVGEETDVGAVAADPVEAVDVETVVVVAVPELRVVAAVPELRVVPASPDVAIDGVAADPVWGVAADVAVVGTTVTRNDVLTSSTLTVMTWSDACGNDTTQPVGPSTMTSVDSSEVTTARAVPSSRFPYRSSISAAITSDPPCATDVDPEPVTAVGVSVDHARDASTATELAAPAVTLPVTHSEAVPHGVVAVTRATNVPAVVARPESTPSTKLVVGSRVIGAPSTVVSEYVAPVAFVGRRSNENDAPAWTLPSWIGLVGELAA